MKQLFTLLMAGIAGIATAQVQIEDATVRPPAPPPAYRVTVPAEDTLALHQLVAPLLIPTNGHWPIAAVDVQIEHAPSGLPIGGNATVTLRLTGAQLAAIRRAVAPAWGLPAAAQTLPIRSLETAVASNGVAVVTLNFAAP